MNQLHSCDILRHDSSNFSLQFVTTYPLEQHSPAHPTSTPTFKYHPIYTFVLTLCKIVSPKMICLKGQWLTSWLYSSAHNVYEQHRSHFFKKNKGHILSDVECHRQPSNVPTSSSVQLTCIATHACRQMSKNMPPS